MTSKFLSIKIRSIFTLREPASVSYPLPPSLRPRLLLFQTSSARSKGTTSTSSGKPQTAPGSSRDFQTFYSLTTPHYFIFPCSCFGIFFLEVEFKENKNYFFILQMAPATFYIKRRGASHLRRQRETLTWRLPAQRELLWVRQLCGLTIRLPMRELFQYRHYANFSSVETAP